MGRVAWDACGYGQRETVGLVDRRGQEVSVSVLRPVRLILFLVSLSGRGLCNLNGFGGIGRKAGVCEADKVCFDSTMVGGSIGR